jgi:cbb3-type cytochrome oxidase subunit 3
VSFDARRQIFFFILGGYFLFLPPRRHKWKQENLGFLIPPQREERGEMQHISTIEEEA